MSWRDDETLTEEEAEEYARLESRDHEYGVDALREGK